jgi:hypothetical protein
MQVPSYPPDIITPAVMIRKNIPSNPSGERDKEAEKLIIDLSPKAVRLIRNKLRLNMLVEKADFKKFLEESDSPEAQRINNLLRISEDVHQRVKDFIGLSMQEQKSQIRNVVSKTQKGEPLDLNQLVDKLNTVFSSADYRSTLETIASKLQKNNVQAQQVTEKALEPEKKPVTKQTNSPLDTHLESISQLIKECDQITQYNNQTISSPEEFLQNIIKRGSEFIKYVRNNQELIKNQFPSFNHEIFEMQTESLREYYAYEKPFSSDTKDIVARREEIEAREQDNNALTDKLTLLHKSRDPEIDETKIKTTIKDVSAFMKKITSQFYSPLDHLKLVSELIEECDQRVKGNNQSNTSPEEFLQSIIKQGSEFIEYVQHNPDLIRRQFPDFNPEIFKRQTESLQQYSLTRQKDNALTELSRSNKPTKDNALTDLSRSNKPIEDKIQDVSALMQKITSQFKLS